MLALDLVRNELKKLPGLGFRSAERIALYLLVEHPEAMPNLITAMTEAAKTISRCPQCGNIAEHNAPCKICADDQRDNHLLCIIEYVPDLIAIERTGSFNGKYHILHGRLSPIRGIGPEQLNFSSLATRIEKEAIKEIILALPNDIEGEATCHYIRQTLSETFPSLKISRIGFGLPSGGTLNYADPATLKSSLDARRDFSPEG